MQEHDDRRRRLLVTVESDEELAPAFDLDGPPLREPRKPHSPGGYPSECWSTSEC
jgi:hypothetical protein